MGCAKVRGLFPGLQYNMTKKHVTETIKVHGEKLYEKLNEIAKEGNVRKIIIKNKHGKKIVEFPVTLGVAGVVIAPVLASIGLVAFFIAECSIEVHRTKE
jgi:hypothetical protein